MPIYVYLSLASIRTVQLYDQLFQPSKATPPPATAPAAGSPASTTQPEQDRVEVTGGQADEQLTHKGLVSLVQSSVDDFFGLLYAKVDQSLDASGTGSGEDQQAAQAGGDGAAATEELELDPVALGGVVAAVQQLVTDIETVDPHVPQVRFD